MALDRGYKRVPPAVAGFPTLGLVRRPHVAPAPFGKSRGPAGRGPRYALFLRYLLPRFLVGAQHQEEGQA